MGDQHWRLIPPLAADGKTQMAIDAWLLHQHLQSPQLPILRFYTWQPIAISLGYHQRRWPAHWSGLHWHNQSVDLVRRPSGGRAVLHQGDLTYAVVMPTQGRSRQESYQRICDALMTAWQRLGVSLVYGQAGRGYIHNPSCFSTATAADLVTSEGYKLVGSAQLRREHSLLQHGSMRLRPNPELAQRVFGDTLMTGYPAWLRQVPIAQLHGQVMAEVERAIATHFRVQLIPHPLSECEQRLALEQFAGVMTPEPL